VIFRKLGQEEELELPEKRDRNNAVRQCEASRESPAAAAHHGRLEKKELFSFFSGQKNPVKIEYEFSTLGFLSILTFF
jgi:hypothetical protein